LLGSGLEIAFALQEDLEKGRAPPPGRKNLPFERRKRRAELQSPPVICDRSGAEGGFAALSPSKTERPTARAMTEPRENRRPIAARSSGWAQSAAAALARAGASPNAVSSASVVFAAAGAGLLLWPSIVGLLACAACVQARLLCNLLDGMIAVEGGRKTPLGPLYNEFPDRIADTLLIVALGYACGLPEWGWFGALAAALTAYVRVFGGALGLAQDFRGPMAKQHRMAVLTAACLAGAVERAVFGTRYALIAACLVIAVGSVITCATRSLALARQLGAR
jgi:CDP-diacylglycerol--glycerol-3-phosphate 3-phosphatidyltransferase